MKKFLYLLFIMTLSGCTQLQYSSTDGAAELTPIPWEQHQQQLQELSIWSLSGKLAIFINKDRQSVNLHWQQQGENYTIQLTSFIGTRILLITKNEEGVEIIDNDDKKYTGQDANQLIKELSPGLDLPISALQQWVKGNPVNASYQLNAQQQVSNLLGQDNNSGLWTVDYQQYKPFSTYYLPSKLNLKRGNIRVKIAINQWKIPTH